MFLKEVIFKNKSSNRFPNNLEIFRSIEALSFDNPITFLVGENGSGKSTLVESIAKECGFGLTGGSKNHFRNNDDETNTLDIGLSWMPKVTRGFFMRAESFFNFASLIDQMQTEDKRSLNPYGGKSLHKQSHGEAFLSLFSNRFSSNTNQIILLDEPEAALSPSRQLSFLQIISELISDGKTQFIVASHSPILLSYPKATIYELSENQITKSDYDDLEHVQLTKNFLNNPSIYLNHLLT